MISDGCQVWYFDAGNSIELKKWLDCFNSILGKCQMNDYSNKHNSEESTVSPPGSSIQQNYGETPGKGFLFWEIENKDKFTSKFYEIYHRYNIKGLS